MTGPNRVEVTATFFITALIILFLGVMFMHGLSDDSLQTRTTRVESTAKKTESFTSISTTAESTESTRVTPTTTGDSVSTTTITATTTATTRETSEPAPEDRKLAIVTIGQEVFAFDPDEVETLRPDIFNPGHFSMFDVLVHIGMQGKIELEYHFDDSMNTHIVDSVNGESYWWYEAYYDGGWPEHNVFRADHYPWKQGTTLRFFRTNPAHLEDVYSAFREEVARRKNNVGKLVIPEVIISGHSFRRVFEDVEVIPHNMRSDVFRRNITTALDVILSLGDEGKITYELKWYESIGRAGIVRSYWVEAIDGDEAYGRCGFVYEAGSLRYMGFSGNHIHLPTDVRILNSPEYVEFFWICI